MAYTKHTTEEKRDYVKEIRDNFVDKVITSLEEGKIPWERGWDIDLAWPENAATKHQYTGMNAIFLMIAGYKDPRWATFSQAKENGWTIKKGSHGIKILRPIYIEHKTGKIVNQKKLDAMGTTGSEKYINEECHIAFSAYTVHNGENIEGLEPLQKKEKKAVDYDKIEEIMKNCGVPINYGGPSAYYDLLADSIHLPDRENFHSETEFYSTALHEISHSTGHPSRLNRDMIGKFGSEDYAYEELIAEFSSVFIRMEKGIAYNEKNNMAYLQSWAQAFKTDKNLIFTAISQADKASKMVLSYEHGIQKSVEQEVEKDQNNEEDLKVSRALPYELGVEENSDENFSVKIINKKEKINGEHDILAIAQEKNNTEKLEKTKTKKKDTGYEISMR